MPYLRRRRLSSWPELSSWPRLSRGSSPNRATDCVSDDHIFLAGRAVERLHRFCGIDLSQRHRGTGAHLCVVLLAHESLGVEQTVEDGDPRIATEEAIRLEEGHLLRQIAIPQLLPLDHRLDSRRRRPGVACAERAHGDDAYPAVLVDQSALEHLHCAGRPDFRERGHGGDAHVGLSDGEHLSERWYRRGRLERSRTADRLEDNCFVVRPDETNELRAVAAGQTTGGDLEQHLERRIVAASDPAENCLERTGLENSEQLIQLVLGGAKGRIFERLKELPQRLGIAHQLAELHETILLRLQHLGRAVRGYSCFAQEVCGVSILRGGEENEEEIVEQSADLLAHCRVLLALECVQERCDYGRPQIGGKFPLDLALQIFDFAVVEEIEGRVELVHVGDRGLSRFETRLSLRRRENLFLLLRPLQGFDAGAAILREIDVSVLQRHELALPHQREEVVVVICRLSNALQEVEEHAKLFLLEPLEHLQLANAIFVEEPRDVVAGPLLLVENHAAFPLEACLDHLQVDLVGVHPERGERFPDSFERARVHRIVRQIELMRANGLDEGLEQVGDVDNRERRLTELAFLGLWWNRRCHAGRSPISVICARSLSPRPLMQISTASPFFHRSLSLTTQATACDVSRAGMIPSSRLRIPSPSTASSSVTET